PGGLRFTRFPSNQYHCIAEPSGAATNYRTRPRPRCKRYPPPQVIRDLNVAQPILGGHVTQIRLKQRRDVRRIRRRPELQKLVEQYQTKLAVDAEVVRR